MNTIFNDDILEFAARYDGPKFHAVLCDPPYELGFMGRSWDSRGVSFRAETWSAIRSLLLPGAHLLAFGGTRTFHRIAVAIEDSGFEIRDTIGWMYGSGFPKSHNLDGAWQGYGTALKPAWEPVIVARKPLVGTVAGNCLAHGCGAINVDGARVGTDDELRRAVAGWQTKYVGGDPKPVSTFEIHPDGISGRWPANIIHDGSDEVIEVMGDAQRFFYCAKASKRERDEGLEEFEKKTRDDRSAWIRKCNVCGKSHCGHDDFSWVEPSPRANHHPTVKPLALTEYLARIILPPVGERRILVPFAGSGSECIGAALAGWDTIVGVEREAEYAEIARARLQYHTSDRV
jgi:site-specific DNA-methyltransferase (adenine-specific)